MDRIPIIHQLDDLAELHRLQRASTRARAYAAYLDRQRSVTAAEAGAEGPARAAIPSRRGAAPVWSKEDDPGMYDSPQQAAAWLLPLVVGCGGLLWVIFRYLLHAIGGE